MATYFETPSAFYSRGCRRAKILLGISLASAIILIGRTQSSSAQSPAGKSSATQPKDYPIDPKEEPFAKALADCKEWNDNVKAYKAFKHIAPTKTDYLLVVYTDKDGEKPLKDKDGKTVVTTISGKELRYQIAYEAICAYQANNNVLPASVAKALDDWSNTIKRALKASDSKPYTDEEMKTAIALVLEKQQITSNLTVGGYVDAQKLLKEEQKEKQIKHVTKTDEEIKALLKSQNK